MTKIKKDSSRFKFRAWGEGGTGMLWTGIHDRGWYGTPRNDEGGCHWVRDKDQSDHAWLILMQFTGLKDKNGIDIYEGDIVRFSRINSDTNKHIEIIGKIGYDHGGFRIYYCVPSKIISPLCHWTASMEVIGNIYENKELLEEQDNDKGIEV